MTDGDHDCLAQRFEENRTRLLAVAHRMLGCLREADGASDAPRTRVVLRDRAASLDGSS